MKVGIVIVARWFRASIDMDGYCDALRRAGHEPVLVCIGNDAGEAGFPVVEADREQMGNCGFWKALALDVAIVFCWLRGSEIIAAIREAGTCPVLRADSDGMSSLRVFPAEAWKMIMPPTEISLQVLKQIRHFFRRYLWLYREEDRELLATIEAAHAVAVESSEAAGNLRKTLLYYHREELAGKLHVVPHSVFPDFFREPVGPALRPARVFCSARWDDPLKDAPVLVKTIKILLRKAPQMEFVIAGKESPPVFDSLRGNARVRLAGQLPRREVPSLLSGCRLLLSSSRFETQPVGALEAVCMGASVVARSLPGFVSLARNGTSGTIAEKGTPASLAAAVLREMELWDNGRRNPLEIAGYWRSRAGNDTVIKGLLAAASPSHAPNSGVILPEFRNP